METNIIPKKILIPYKVLGVVFCVLVLLNFLSVLSSVSRHFYIFALMYAAYVGLYLILAYGFWKMKKWIVFILGGLTLVMLVIDISHLIGSTKNIVQISISFAVLCALFAFSYFTRNFLNDDYKNYKMLGLFTVFLVLSQVAIIFLK